MPLDWVSFDVAKVDRIVLGISHPMVTETALPDRELVGQFVTNAVRRAALDVLDNALEGGCGRGRQEDMKMIRHQDEGVEHIDTLLTIVEQRINEDFAGRRLGKQWTALPGSGGHKVCPGQLAVPFGDAHVPQGLKPSSFFAAFGTAEAVP